MPTAISTTFPLTKPYAANPFGLAAFLFQIGLPHDLEDKPRFFDWFKTEDGATLKPEMLDRVVGIRVAPNMAINVTAEVAQIYFDNFVLS